jgi:CubicO group peptidase (beta-lactamase class C family)
MHRCCQVFIQRAALCIAVLGMGLSAAAQQSAHIALQKSASASVDMTLVKPESVGFSSERLERLHAVMQQTVDKKQLAGVVTILARHGKIVDYRTYGVRDLATNAPMTQDTIFRDFSMTKPVTGVAMMILFEQGKWLPSDPISKYIPQFAYLKVFNGVDASGRPILVDPEHAPTMLELMTHTAGFSYGNGATVADKMYKDLDVAGSSSLEDAIGKLARIPLFYQPGKAWLYSMSMDIQGYIVEQLSGKPLPEFLSENLYQPLGMKDAGYYVPAEKRGRFATLYENDGHGGLQLDTSNAIGIGNYQAPPKTPSGGGGMVSTAEDYYRFAQMLANGGELNGHRILAPATVRLMTSNHLPPSLLTGEYRIGLQTMRQGLGYGYNGAVVFDPPAANLPEGKGTYYWDGAAGTWFWVDPTNDVVFVGMIQRMKGGGPNVEFLSRSLVYQALVDPSK